MADQAVAQVAVKEPSKRRGAATKGRMAGAVAPAAATETGRKAAPAARAPAPAKRKASSTAATPAPAKKRKGASGRPRTAAATRVAPTKAAPRTPKQSKEQQAKKKPVARGARGKSGRVVAPTPPPDMRVRELVPQEVCGHQTTVEQLFRVDEIAHDGRRTVHLVFLDRHGWYCEHGASCPAVREVMKLGRQRLLRAG